MENARIQIIIEAYRLLIPSKLFDMVLWNRLELWFKPYREQAGAQRGRGCIEHIVSLRILTDYAKKKNKKLSHFLTFKKRMT